MRLPNTDDLSAQMEAPRKEPEMKDREISHINALADRLCEAFHVVARQNKISRAKQKTQYCKNKLVTFQKVITYA